MNLVIDQGNTVTKVAVFEAGNMIEMFSYDNFGLEICRTLLTTYSIQNCVFCTVTEPKLEVLAYLDNNLPVFLFIDENTVLPIKSVYKTPNVLGKDRLAAVVEAIGAFPERNLLIIDIGTAITYEFVDSNSVYLGGNISPGITMRFKALNAFTGKLPLIDYHGDLPDIGYDTDTAIRTGVVRGVVNEIRMYIEEYCTKHTDIEIILTGGHTRYIESRLDRSVYVDENLVLKGLNRILNYNVK